MPKRTPLLIMMITAALTLTACASGVPRTTAPTLKPPEADKAECPPLPQPTSGRLADLLADHVTVAKAYHQCRDRHKALTDWMETTDAVLHRAN